MTTRYRWLAVFFSLLLMLPAFAQRLEFNYPDAWGENGFNLVRQHQAGVRVIHSIPRLVLNDIDVDGTPMKMIEVFGSFIPNEEGAPDLPGNGRFIAIPQGAMATLKINAVRREIFENIDFLPASQIPLADDDSPLHHVKDMSIYGKDEFYPADPFRLSEPASIRGVDVVMLGITPYQYNPVSKQLIVYRDIDLEVEFEGGNGQFGDEMLRSRWWDPILEDAIFNYTMLPQVDYAARHKAFMQNREQGCEYLIVVPDHPDFLAWADSIRVFRNNQGITTQVVTTTQMGGNNFTQMKNYIVNAYNTWDIAPAAILFLGDYGTSGNTITSGSGSGYISDNYLVDVNNDHLPDITQARITARDANELQRMVMKFINYERNPPTNPNYYEKPITAMGWQTERWFQICSETVNGFWEYQLNKQPLRQNNIYSGTPGTVWSTNSNTSIVVNVFGPNGLNYIPATPSHLNNFGWNANATSINNAINAGAFMIMHRDHGSTTGWGEPSYGISNLSGLNNNDLLHVFSINCLTGKFNIAGECFTEAFHRHQKGALSLTAASETSYSFVNDTYVWGLMDNLWPNFLPQFGTTPPSRDILPAFGNTAGKYFLQQSNWPSNPSEKQITYYLFHHHGDAFSTVYSEMPQHLTVNHMPVLLSGLDFFEVTADPGSLIALSVNNELIGVGTGTGMPVTIPIVSQLPGNNMLVTITKQNYYRYENLLEVIPPDGPYVIFNQSIINDPTGNNNNMLDYGESIILDVALKNVGLENALNVNIVLSTSSPHISFTNNSHIIPSILPGETYMASGAFAFNVSNEIPNEQLIEFVIQMTSGAHVWSNTFFLTAYAPVFSVGNLIISDPTGNNNGVADPGETVNMLISTLNSGNSLATNITGQISCSSPYVTIVNGTSTIPELAPEQSANAQFTISVSAAAPVGTPVAIHYNVAAGAYMSSKIFTIQLGQIIEAFEAGNFSGFGWTFAGIQPWTVTNVGAFQGTYAAKSGVITHSQSSQMILEYDVAVADSVSFYRRVSSENNDYLRFYVNGVQAGQWSGNQAWARVAYPVNPGLNTFKWEYVKSATGSSGEDCAWVDYIVFPIRSACPAPRNVSASSVTAHTANINWAPGGDETIWEIIYGATGFNPQNAGTLIQNITDFPYQLSGLTPVTGYDVYVRSKCSDEFISMWNGPIAFTTLCANFSLPFTEGFGTASVSCWSFPQGQGNWSFGTSYTPPSSQSGAPNAYFSWTPSTTNYNFSLTSPLIDATNMTDIKINYLLYLDNYSNSTVENMAVEYKELDAGQWTLLELFTSSGMGNTTVQFVRTDQALQGMEGKLFQVRFRAHGPNSFNIDGWGLDDILVHGTELSGLPGDANCDGLVNVLDVITSVNFVTGLNPQPFCFENADVNSDGNVNVLDVIATVNIITGRAKNSTFEVDSETAHIYLNHNGIQLQSDGTLAGLQFEIEGVESSQLNFVLPGYEFVGAVKDGKFTGLIFSFNNTPLPAGTIHLFDFITNITGLKWGNVVAGNLNAEQVSIIRHQGGEYQLSAYPNPTYGQFTVEVNIPNTAETEIILTDVMGREITAVHQGLMNAGAYRFELETDFPSGLYFLQIRAVAEGETVVKHLKVVITK